MVVIAVESMVVEVSIVTLVEDEIVMVVVMKIVVVVVRGEWYW